MMDRFPTASVRARSCSCARQSRRGETLIELLVAGMLSLLVGAGLVIMVRETYGAEGTVAGQNMSNAGSRRPLDILSDELRMAQSYAGATKQAISQADATSITIYNVNPSSGLTDGTAYTKYWLDNGTSPPSLKSTVTTSSGSVTAILVSGMQSLAFTYYVSGGSYTTTAANWVTTASPSAPTAAELPNIGAIAISASVSINGYTHSLSSFVRLRNSPLS